MRKELYPRTGDGQIVYLKDAVTVPNIKQPVVLAVLFVLMFIGGCFFVKANQAKEFEKNDYGVFLNADASSLERFKMYETIVIDAQYFTKSLWEVPLCLWLSKKVGIFVTVILNAGLGSVLGIFTATTSLWMICPYSWVPHLMISVLGILPNGEPVADQSTAMAFWMIILVLVISLAWFAALSFLTARWFEKKEVG